MERIGIRELRQHASRWVRRAAAGASFEITDRGRPVARLIPLGSRRGIERLREEGRIRPAEGDLLALGPRIPPQPGILPPSQLVERLREEER
jgi:prevent-host-death family protein